METKEANTPVIVEVVEEEGVKVVVDVAVIATYQNALIG